METTNANRVSLERQLVTTVRARRDRNTETERETLLDKLTEIINIFLARQIN